MFCLGAVVAQMGEALGQLIRRSGFQAATPPGFHCWVLVYDP